MNTTLEEGMSVPEDEQPSFPLPVAVKEGETALSMRAKVVRLEAEIAAQLPPVEMPVTHHFSKGLYARELFIPKGTVLTGKIHKHENLNIISKGDISVLTEEGLKRIKAPYTLVSPPGTKRAGYAHEDTIWITIHATDETDLEKIEEEVIAKTFDDVPALEDSLRKITTQKDS